MALAKLLNACRKGRKQDIADKYEAINKLTYPLNIISHITLEGSTYAILLYELDFHGIERHQVEGTLNANDQNNEPVMSLSRTFEVYFYSFCFLAGAVLGDLLFKSKTT